MKDYEALYARVLGIVALVGFASLVLAIVVTLFGLLPSEVNPEEWKSLWLRPASEMREQVVSRLSFFRSPATVEELSFLAVGFFGIATAVTLSATIPLFFARGRKILGLLGLCQLIVLATAVLVTAL
jgi:hypothetical protein